MIVGMGEVHEDVVDVAIKLSELQVESIPINFLNSIDGTPLQAVRELDPRFCLKVLAMFRLTNPKGRAANCRWSRSQSAIDAGAGPLSGEFDVCQ
jgi:biotin synthase-like enzyme